MNWSRWKGIFYSAALALGLSPPGFAQKPDVRDLPTRMELHSFHSQTLSDSQVLTGDTAGKEVTLTGALRIAGGTGRLPIVVILHGSGGIGTNIELWGRQFLAMGISTFVIDSFTGRGLPPVIANPALLGRLNLILDAYRALDVLAHHPRVDPNRIVLIGFSRGGQSALYASMKRFHQAWNKSGIDFAAYIPIYPDCMTSYQGETDVVDRPIRIFHGELDDFNPLAPCRAYVQRLQAAHRDVQLTTYPNAHHAFDSAYYPMTPTPEPLAQTTRRCVLHEDPIGVIINTETGKPFSYHDPCVQRGPHFAFNPAASLALRQAVQEFLTILLHRPKPG